MPNATLNAAVSLLAVAFVGPALAGPAEIEDVRMMKAQFYQAFLDAGGEAIEAIFAKNFAYQHGSGTTYGADDFIALVASKAVTVTRADTPTMEFRDFGNVIVTYGNGPVGGMIGEEPYLVDLRFVNIWHRKDDTWELAHRNSELLPLDK
ncbi:MAG: nuclear transport factor 2 family protein [Pseudomonadota bacterium]